MTRLGIREVEAGNRAKLDSELHWVLWLTGSPHDETEPEKATYYEADAMLKSDLARD